MALRKIVMAEDDILRKKSRKVETVDDKIRKLLNDMAETMYHGNGGGLAAVQVGILKRLIVVDMGTGLYQLINPIIIASEGTQFVTEGCLSVPGRYGKLIRPKKVTIQALNPDGETITITAENDLAKCFCHEIDHLDGTLFTDKVIEYL